MKASNEVLSMSALAGSGEYSICRSVIEFITPPMNLLRIALAYSRFLEIGTKKSKGMCSLLSSLILNLSKMISPS
jgi:hypothetical protein